MELARAGIAGGDESMEPQGERRGLHVKGCSKEATKFVRNEMVRRAEQHVEAATTYR